LPGIYAATIINDFKAQALLIELDAYNAIRCVCMTLYVGNRLDHDPIGGDFDGCRQWRQ
jgi:hypothetical protein